jgi:hypothetical protein
VLKLKKRTAISADIAASTLKKRRFTSDILPRGSLLAGEAGGVGADDGPVGEQLQG